jgi:hypothetical protein
MNEKNNVTLLLMDEKSCNHPGQWTISHVTLVLMDEKSCNPLVDE